MINSEELKDLKFMIENGFMHNQVAEVLGKSVVEVRKYAHTHQIYSPLKKKEKDGLFFCTKCTTYKTREEFYKNQATTYGITAYCKICHSEYKKLMQKKRRFAEIDAIIEKNKEFEKTKAEATGETKRRCSTCGITKDINDFHWYEKNKSVKKQCKSCRAAYRKKWELKKLEERGY